MTTLGSTLKQLQAEWTALAAQPRTRAAAAGWAAADPRLTGCADLTETLARCHRRGDPAAANAALAALLARADADALARRTVLQALLPGLAALARRAQRAGWVGHHHRGVWRDCDELDQELLTLAWSRVAAHAGGELAWPASVLLGQVWRRVRQQVDRDRAHGRRCVALDVDEVDTVHDVDLAAAIPWEQHAGVVLHDAVRSGAIGPVDGALIYGTRVLGLTTTAVADRVELDYWAAAKRRQRAELRLVPTLELAA